jgi:UDP-N-acetyl-2-amino-2-deoxyglucuronate dehydrogenase
MKRIKLGIIGCGVIGAHHARHAKAHPRIDLVALADVREEAARKLAQEHGVPHVMGSAEALIDHPEVEAVVLALTANLRTPLALRAFAAGKHVLTEKPVAMNAGEVRQMIEASASRGLVGACCSSRHRFLSSTRAATQAFASGKLGAIRVVRARINGAAGGPPKSPPPVWRLRTDLNAGGIMSNWGCYDLDYLLGITGWTLRPRTVLAQVWSVPQVFSDRVAPGSNAETHVAALIRCDDGVVITLERGEFMPTAGDYAWQISGDRGALRLNLLPKAGNQVLLDQADHDKGVVTEVIHEGDENWDMVHAGPVQDFADAILDGRSPLTSLAHALVVQQITDAIYASARNGEAVTIE